jgi:hypothetical protein
VSAVRHRLPRTHVPDGAAQWRPIWARDRGTGSSGSVLAAYLPHKHNRSLCGTKLVMPTTITAQNGAVIKQNTPIVITGCPKARTTRGKQARTHVAS